MRLASGGDGGRGAAMKRKRTICTICIALYNAPCTTLRNMRNQPQRGDNRSPTPHDGHLARGILPSN